MTRDLLQQRKMLHRTIHHLRYLKNRQRGVAKVSDQHNALDWLEMTAEGTQRSGASDYLVPHTPKLYQGVYPPVRAGA
jgi:hypothetical protein